MSNPFLLIPGKLNLAQLKKIIYSASLSDQRISLDPACLSAIHQSYNWVKHIIKTDQIVYGVNTGFGLMANQNIPLHQLKQLQRNIILSHACGVGDLLSDDTVALILLLKINNLAQGYSGVRQQLIDYLCDFYNHGLFPCIPQKGSVGASGDLAPLAHLALPLIGEGQVRYQNEIIEGSQALKMLHLPPLELEPKEGLALLNGLQVSTAMTVKALWLAETLFNTAVMVGALSVDVAQGSDTPFDERLHKVRGHRTQMAVAQIYHRLLQGSAIRHAHLHCKRVQDPYSLRCQPQIMGAVLHQLCFVKETLAVEINAVSDNPLVFAEDECILSGGNFHGEIIAMAADNLALAIAEIGANAERRIALLIDNRFSGLPPFLVKDGGINSGFMIPHVTAAACASDNKALAHPHSVDSISTSANQEDHVSMATNAALRLQTMIENTATIIAIELLAATQALEFHRPKSSSVELENLYQQVRQDILPYTEDRCFAPDIQLMIKRILAGNFIPPWLDSIVETKNDE